MGDEKAGWTRVRPARSVDAASIARLLERASVARALEGVEPLAGGLSNSLNVLRLSGGRRLVLRIYERDPAACAKEVDLLELVRPTVPVPDVVWAERAGWDDLPPCALLTFVEGITLRALKERGDGEAMARACRDVGRVLARIGAYELPRGGVIGPGLEVGAPLLEGADPVPRFLEASVASAAAAQRIGPELGRRVCDVAWEWARRLAEIDVDQRLVHCDFGSPNLLVSESDGGWRVSGVLDWEFAVAGSPLVDLGHFLRYERRERPLREPHFTRGFLDAGGTLPDDWRPLSRVLDLVALCEMLSREALPQSVATELVDLVAASVTEVRSPA